MRSGMRTLDKWSKLKSRGSIAPATVELAKGWALFERSTDRIDGREKSPTSRITPWELNHL
jgi:hypothetical protein